MADFCKLFLLDFIKNSPTAFHAIDNISKRLKENGYDVTKTGKTTSISKTIITNKKELETDKVKEIKNLLGVGSISNKKNLSSKVHLTIVIGKDFNK